MRATLFILITMLLAGCFPSKAWLYRSVNEEGRYEERYKGSLNVSYGEKLDGKTSFSINAAGNLEGKFGVSLQLNVEKGSEVKLDLWELTFSSPEFENDIITPLQKMSLSVYGRDGNPGYYKYIHPGESIVGSAENETLGLSPTDAYLTSATVSQKSPARLFIKLPVFIVNGKRISVPPIEFELVEIYNYGYSLQ